MHPRAALDLARLSQGLSMLRRAGNGQRPVSVEVLNGKALALPGVLPV